MQSQRRSLRTRVSYAVKEDYYDSRHCAGINCLVLDPTTPSSRLSGGAGILYSGGRDSIINSWDLNLDFAGIRAREEELLETQAEHVNQRRASVSNKSENRYSRTPSIPQRKQSLSAPNDLNTPTADSPSQHASELLSDDATASPLGRSPPNEDFHDRISNLRREEYIRKTRSVQFSSLKGNRSFSVPEAEIQKRSYKIFEKLPQSTFLRSFQSHSDWVNDIVLCNGNQNLISASSDRMVLLWSTVDNFHVALGQHSDYVKVLAHPSGQSWVASAGLDRRIILWDVNEARGEVTSFKSKALSFDTSPSASIYALACNPSGTVLVSGAPDKTVKMWDPRSGKEAIGLKGHTDCIRSVLVSDDGKWVISASSDTTIKLWSVAQPQRCMVTYSHCHDPVWCLYSNHPDLDTFWSGSRDGWVTKTARRRVGGDGRGRVEDELVDCVAVCRETGPVSRLVAVDDLFVWTATNHSTINRWRDVPFRHATVVASHNDVPDDSEGVFIPAAAILRQNRGFLDDTTSQKSFRFSLTSSMDNGTAMAPNAINSVSSIHRIREKSLDEDSFDEEGAIEPVWRAANHSIVGRAAITRFAVLNNRRHVVTEDSDGTVSLWDIILCVKVKDFAQESTGKKGLFESVREKLNTVEWVANWCTVDNKNGFLMVHLEEPKCFDAEIYHEDSGCEIAPSNEDQRINVGKWLLSHLFICYINCCYQKIPAAAILNHDFYLGHIYYTPDPESSPSSEPFKFPAYDVNGPLLFGSTMYAQSPDEPADAASQAESAPPRVENFSSVGADGRAAALDESSQEAQALAAVEAVIKSPVRFMPNMDEAPPIRLPPLVPIILSVEDSPDASCFIDRFRSTVVALGWARETLRLTDYMPRWLYDTIMTSQPPMKDPPKLSFMMIPHPGSGLQDLPNNTNKLSSNRMIRLRKLLAYVAERIDIFPPDELVKEALLAEEKRKASAEAAADDDEKSKQETADGASAPPSLSEASRSRARTESANGSTNESASGRYGFFGKKAESSPGAATNGTSSTSASASLDKAALKALVKPELYMELCCYDKPLNPKMTLATVRHHLWKSSGDVVLTYRRKAAITAPTPSTSSSPSSPASLASKFTTD